MSRILIIRNIHLNLSYPMNLNVWFFQNYSDCIVSARELHAELEITEEYSSWINSYTGEMLIASVDFFERPSSINDNDKNGPDILLSIDAAKAICLLQKSNRGKEMRVHLSFRERQLRLSQFGYGMDSLSLQGQLYLVNEKNGKLLEFNEFLRNLNEEYKAEIKELREQLTKKT